MRPHSAAHEKSSDFHVPSLSSTSSGIKISPRPATAALHTARSNTSTAARKSIPSVNNSPHKDARSYFDSFNKEETREIIAQSSASWLLSTDFRGQAGMPCGLISNLGLSQAQHLTLLFPKEKNVPDLEYREMHQIIHELTSGIFGVNEMPSLRIEPNFDLSSTCQLPLAYKNTKVGQVMIEVDYAMKSLWHGACVSHSKRSKLAERWRNLLNVNTATGEYTAANQNVVNDFNKAGQKFITSDSTFNNLYDELNQVDPSDSVSEKENKFFNQYSDFVRCVLTCSVCKVQASSTENVVAFDSTYDVTSAITLPDEDFIASTQLQRLRRRLRHQLKMIRKGLSMDPTIKRNLSLLKFISAVSLILVSLRRRLMRVPDVDEMLSLLQSDNIHTETELPPFAIGKPGDHPCEIFTVNSRGERRVITHCHGEIQLDVDTANVTPLSDKDWCRKVQDDAINYLKSLFEKPRPDHRIPTVTLDGKEHYVIHVPLTTYYSVSPAIPSWLHSRYQLISNMRPKRLLMSDIQLAELFKQTFGFKRALANKSVEGELNLSACRGLAAPFITLMRKIASASLFSPDMQGMTLLHYACIHNRSDILSILLSQNPNLSTRRTEINSKSTPYQKTSESRDNLADERSGATALIFATRCGALPCVTALLASKANPMLSDAQGKSAIHTAAYCDQVPIIRSLLRRYPNLLETPAGGDNATPLLVAASSGALLSLEFLLANEACVTARDVNGDGVIERAALNYHADVIEFFVEGEKKFKPLNIYTTFVGLLQSTSVIRQDAALRCLEVLLHRNAEHWRPLQEAGAVQPLVKLLQSNKRRPKSSTQSETDPDPDVPVPTPIRSLACSVVCLMSEQDRVRKEVASSGAIPTLISLLKPVHLTPRAKHITVDLEETPDERFELQSRSSVVLSDLACVDASGIAEHEGIPPLVELLQVDVVDVLVNAVATLAALCRGDRSGVGEIQSRIINCGAAGFFVEFLRAKDDALQTVTADAVAAICQKNEDIQNEFVALGTYKPLIAILRGHCISAQMKAAMAIDAMSEDNLPNQKQAVMDGAPDALCRLFQIWSDTVKERGACALWALAGSHPEQQRSIANRIGTKQIIDMLISKSDTLQLIGCQAVAAISRNLTSGQNRMINDGTISPLVRLLRLPRTSRKVTIAVLHAIKCLCIGVAHVNNKKAQEVIADEGAIELLLDKIWLTSRDETMQVDLILCLSRIVTGCPKNEGRLSDIDTFDFDIILELLNSADLTVRCRASCALALFSFNRIPQQEKILKLGGISYFALEAMLECNDPMIRITVAFQLVVLARVVARVSVVDASARGVIALIEGLEETWNDDVIVKSEHYIASLAHTRAGVPEAIVSAGAVAKLLFHLKSSNDLIRIGASQALGYLSFNRTASRELMAACRSTEGVFESLLEHIGEDGKISNEFLAEFQRQKIVGLPISKPPSRNQNIKPHVVEPRDQEKTTRPRTAKKSRVLSPLSRVLVTEEIRP